MRTIAYVPLKSIRAALRLAAIYSCGVAVMLVLLYLATESPSGLFREVLPSLPIPFAICFATAFLLLAVARRAGFMALTLFIFGLWSWQMSMSHYHGTRLAIDAFVNWALLSAPLHAMIALGFPAWRSAKWGRWRAWATFSVWLSVLVLMPVILRLSIFFGEPVRPLSAWWGLQVATVVLPPAMTSAALFRIYGDSSLQQATA